MIGSHILKRNHKNKVPRATIFFDTESHVKTKLDEEEIKLIEADPKTRIAHKHEFYLNCAIYCKDGEEIWRKVYKGNTLNNFWYDVDKINEKEIYVFAHNAKYDTLITNTVKYMMELKYKLMKFSDDNPFFMVWEKEIEKKKITILSSTNYYKMSLEKLGEIFDLNKLKINYEGDDEEKQEIYCMRDVEILKTAMLHFINFIKNEALGNFSMTIAGQAFNAYRHRFMYHNIYIHRNINSVKLERLAYAGGRNECFYIGKCKGNMTSFDVNSMYPAVMLNEKYPIKLITYRKSISVDNLKDVLKKGYLVIAECYINTDENVFFKKNGKLIFPVGKFKTYLSTPEIIYGLNNNLIEKIGEINIYQGDVIFKQYVEYFYKKRQEAKKAKNEVLTTTYKLFLNSLYGKFGQKDIVWEKIGDADIDVTEERHIFDVDLLKYTLIKIMGGSIFKKKEDIIGYSEATNAFCAIASHVTAYARMKLWQYIKIAGKENVFYCDTDSLFVNEEGKKRLEESGLIDDYVLGYIKKEKEGELYINGCKDYIFNNKVKLKGVKSNSVKIDDNKYICERWKSYAQFIKTNDLEYKVEYFLKKLKRKYDKGIKKLNGYVKPFYLSEW